MSIKLQKQMNEYEIRLETLERKVNLLNNEPRKIAGTEDRDPKPKKPGRPQAKKAEGEES